MRLLSALGLVGILLSSTVAQGAPTILSTPSDRPEDLPQIRVLSSTSQGMSLIFEMPTLTVEDVSNGTDSYKLVTIPGGIVEGDVGTPALPTFSRLLEIPDDAAVDVQYTRESTSDLAGYRLLPMQSDEPGNAFALNAAAYARDAFDSAPAVASGPPALGRDLRLVALKFRPVDYNPVTGTLRVADRIRVDVSFRGKSEENVRLQHRTTMAPSFDLLYRGLVANYSGPPEGVTIQNGTYLIICPNDNAVTTRLQPLVDWRTRKGQPVVLATTAQTGTTTTSIKNWIQNAYDTWPNPPEYICLVGDVGGSYSIPTFYENLSGYNGEGDHPYTQLAGNDILADANIGRLSVSTLAELETVVAKVVGYESTPQTGSDPDWFRRACLVGDPNASGISTVQVQQWIKTRLRQIGYTQIDTIFNGDFVGQMSTSLNRGDTVFSYRGYWQMSGWGNSNTYTLTNGWKLPFVVAITCDTGSFAGGTSRTEGFLRAGSAATPKGGLGAIGTATTGTHTRFNNCVHYGICYGLLYQDLFTMGGALTRGKYELYLNYQSVDPNRVVIWSQWNNLMGDPGAEVFTGFPDPMTVTHPASVPVGANAVGVTVRTAQSAPIEGAQVCLWKGSEIYVTGLTDAQGFVDLPVSAATAGDLKVTVTKHNRYPYQATVPVSTATTYVSYNASLVDDDAVGNSSGNGDGLINPGESIELPVQLKNFGTQLAPGVTAHVSSTDPYVQITRADVIYGDIPGGGAAWAGDPFLLSVTDACPHGHAIRLNLEAQSGANSYHSIVDLNVVSADLVAETYQLQDVGSNGLLDPGETGTLKISLRNLGGSAAVNPVASLLTLSEFVDVPDGQGSYATIAIGALQDNAGDTYTIHASPDTYRGYKAKLQLLLSFSGGRVDTTTVEIPVGTRSSTDPCGPDRYGYYAFDNTDTSYPEAPTYNWIELDGDGGAVQHSLNDYGDQQDKSKTLDLPFPFPYYGKTYTKGTLCSNGWFAFGSQYNQEYRNWTIPGAGGPQAMLAAFWDDLYLQNGTSKILTKYDATNHTFVVEWSRLKNMVGNADGNGRAHPLRSGILPDRDGRRSDPLPVQHGQHRGQHGRLCHGGDRERDAGRRSPDHLLQPVSAGSGPDRRRSGDSLRADPGGDRRDDLRHRPEPIGRRCAACRIAHHGDRERPPVHDRFRRALRGAGGSRDVLSAGDPRRIRPRLGERDHDRRGKHRVRGLLAAGHLGPEHPAPADREPQRHDRALPAPGDDHRLLADPGGEGLLPHERRQFLVRDPIESGCEYLRRPDSGPALAQQGRVLHRSPGFRKQCGCEPDRRTEPALSLLCRADHGALR